MVQVDTVFTALRQLEIVEIDGLDGHSDTDIAVASGIEPGTPHAIVRHPDGKMALAIIWGVTA